eukprot:CAMPEP_0172167046 /NCGR_PEP_ID=MMETSP1050-20130122/9347_1 /TAXON_ID=233186 /ORGANISM="Cryptomonas curvata, Strain CCAP979/52" /LENGTH=130 /DNA_ID=CAMNT_0012837779 /DNA_START=163 /DNA_END=552 /DNA_ORIENTATION=+
MGNDYSTCCQSRATAANDDKDVSAKARQLSSNAGERSAPTSENFKEEKIGIGAYFHVSPDDPKGLAVKALLSGGPAHGTGRIAVGDVVLEVDGHGVYGKRQAELAEVLLGPHGSEVKLKFRSAGTGQPYE